MIFLLVCRVLRGPGLQILVEFLLVVVVLPYSVRYDMELFTVISSVLSPFVRLGIRILINEIVIGLIQEFRSSIDFCVIAHSRMSMSPRDAF